MLQKPWPAWLCSNLAAVAALLVWSAHAWPPQILGPFQGPTVAAIQGAALIVGAWTGSLWARKSRIDVSFVPMCFLLATLAVATALVGVPAATHAGIAAFWFGAGIITAIGQATMFVALVHPTERDDVPEPQALGPVLAVQMGAAALGVAAVAVATRKGCMPHEILGAAAALWVVSGVMFALMRRAPSAAQAPHTATVSMVSLLRQRRWPLFGVAVLCGVLAAGAPGLWVQSLQFIAGLQGSDTVVAALMLAGYGIGAKVASSVAQRPATVRLALAVTLLACAAFFLTGMIHFNALPEHMQKLTAAAGRLAPWRRATLEVLLTALVVLPGSVSTGACLPLVASAVGNGAPAAARIMSRVLRAYGAGMVGGAALVPWLAPQVGLEATMRAVALLYTLAALVSSSAATPQRKVMRSLDIAALATALAIAVWPRWTVRDVEWPRFRDAPANYGETGLHYRSRLVNMRPHARQAVLPEDQGSS